MPVRRDCPECVERARAWWRVQATQTQRISLDDVPSVKQLDQAIRRPHAERHARSPVR